MPNRHRLHVPGGMYYLFRNTDSRHPIFSKPEEYARFGVLLRTALATADAKLLGYCWLPESLHMVLEIGDRPVSNFMRDLIWRYSRNSWQREAEDRPWFRERYRSTLIQPETHLELLIRHIHYLALRSGLTKDLDSYPYSSHGAYSGRAPGSPVYTRKLLRLLGCHGADRTPYFCAMAEAPPESLGLLFQRGMPDSPGVVGDQLFVLQRSAAATVRTPPPARLIERVVAEIAERQDLAVEDICSRSRRRELVVARAQIVWLAMRRNIGTLNDVARHLRHSPSALSRAVARYRYSRPELFVDNSFASLKPGARTRPRFINVSGSSSHSPQRYATQDP